MAEQKWVDLTRFSARLEVINNPTLRKRQLRLCIDDPQAFRASSQHKPFFSMDAAERDATSKRFVDALTSWGFVESRGEAQERYVRGGGNPDSFAADQTRPFVFYTDDLNVTFAKLKAIIPSLDYSDFVDLDSVDAYARPFQWIADHSFADAAARHQGLHVRFDDRGDSIAVDDLSPQTFYVPQGHLARCGKDFGVNDEASQELARGLIVDSRALSAFVDGDVGIVECWSSPEHCVQATGVSRADVRAMTPEHGVPLAVNEKTKSVFLVVDARFVKADTSMLLDAGLKRQVQARQALRSQLQSINDSQVKPLTTEEVAAAQPAQAATRQQIELAVRTAMREHILSANEYVGLRSLQQSAIQAVASMEPADRFLGIYNEPEGHAEAQAFRVELNEMLRGQPRNSWLLMVGQHKPLGEYEQARTYWYPIMSLGEQGLAPGLMAPFFGETPPKFDEVYALTMKRQVMDFKSSVEMEIVRERNVSALATLVSGGLANGHEFKDFKVNGIHYSKAMITGFKHEEGCIQIAGTKRERRGSSATASEVNAVDFAEAIGLSIERMSEQAQVGTYALRPIDVLEEVSRVGDRVSGKTDGSKESGDESRIDDVGEKIGGARKDFYANRLTVGDLDAMNELEKAFLVVKANVWPKIDYSALQGAGVHPNAAYAVKVLKDKINVKCPRPDLAVQFISGVSVIRDEMEKVKTIEDFNAACLRVLDEFNRAEPGYERYSWHASSKYHLAIGRDAITVLKDNYRACVMATRRTLNNTSWENLIRTRVQELDQTNNADAGKKYRPERPHLDHLVRKGADFRGDRDVTGEELLEVFGFRGIEYGNWLPQDERQLVLNHAYDAFRDLALVTGLEPYAMSLGGRLALAFGARGKGKFAAHFEPSKFVCNMTRLRGAGSVAHEWGHALDRHLAINSGHSHLFLSDVPEAAAVPDWIKPIRSVMAILSTAPRPIAQGIERCFKKMVEKRQQSQTNVFGFATMDNYTRFNPDDPARAHYIESVNGLVASAYALITDEALLADAVGAAKAFSEFNLVSKIVQIYRLHGGDNKSFISGRTNDYMTHWARVSVNDPRRYAALKDLEASGAKYTPAVTRPGMLNKDVYDVVSTGFYKAAKRLDEKRGRDYFALPTEMFARAFEVYVFDALKARGMQSDYLVHGVEPERYASDAYAGNPYPVADERVTFNDGFSHAMQSLEEHLKRPTCAQVETEHSVEP